MVIVVNSGDWNFIKFYDILLGGKSLEYNKKYTFVNNSSLYDLSDYHNFFL